MSYYDYHLFFCCNQRPADDISCSRSGSEALYTYAKDRVKALKIPGNVRVNRAGCMGRCEEGPTLVIYPQAVWYTCKTPEDVDEILQQHLLNHRLVERLLL